MRMPGRKSWMVAAGLPLAVCLGAGARPAVAAPVVYYHAGAWYAFTNKNASGADVCGIATQNAGDGRRLTLTYTIGGTQLHFDAEKPTWTIPDGTPVDFSLQIDRNQPWPGQAIGLGTHLGWDLGADSVREFDSQFRAGAVLSLTFPSGNEPPWNLSLAGSTGVAQTLWRCVHDLSIRDHVVTPSGSSAAPTQPYGQAPTQPYAPPSQGPTQPTGVPQSSNPPGNMPSNTPPDSSAPQTGVNPPAPTQPNAPPAKQP
jgi:hypothetical protein